jgi:hypothetical protein
MGDNNFLTLDSYYFGEKKDWRKKFNFCGAFFKRKLLISDY